MQIMGIVSLAPMPNTSKPCKANKVYPYLVKKDQVTEANQVWCTDITYLPMEKGHAYLVAIMDWHSRAILSWKVSNSMDSTFCIQALREAMKKTGTTSPSAWTTKVAGWTTNKTDKILATISRPLQFLDRSFVVSNVVTRGIFSSHYGANPAFIRRNSCDQLR